MNLRISTSEIVHLVIDEIWNRGDLEMADAWFTHDYVNHGGLIPEVIRGPEAIKLSVALYRRAFPTFQIAVDELTTDSALIVLRWVAHSGPPLLDSAVPRKGGLRGITRCRLRDGKIAESWTVWDSRVALVRWEAVKQKLAGDEMDDVKSRGSRSVSRTED
jgi:predicted SnoaL-like aldol condensation-catalyzing enzyme